MRDAIGGSVNLVIIVVFMVIVSGYLAFNISYTKAFKVKNKIISTYEEYDGKCDTSSTACGKQIKNYMKEIGYNVRPMAKSDIDQYYANNVTGGGAGVTSECSNVSAAVVGTSYCSVCPDGDYCAIRVLDKKVVTGGHVENYVYYKIITRVTMDIPIINKVMSGFTFFQVSGDTKKFRVKE